MYLCLFPHPPLSMVGRSFIKLCAFRSLRPEHHVPLVFSWVSWALPLLFGVNLCVDLYRGGRSYRNLCVCPLHIFGKSHGLLVCSGAPLGPTAALLASVNLFVSNVKHGVCQASAALAHNMRACKNIHIWFPF